MNILNKVFFVSTLLVGLGSYGQGLVSEIINNTDEEIIVDCKSKDGKICVTKSYLINGIEIQPKIQLSPAIVKIAPQTRNILSGLNIPIVNAIFQPSVHEPYSSSIKISFNGSKYKSKNYYGNENGVFVIRQRGDLLHFNSIGIMHSLISPVGLVTACSVSTPVLNVIMNEKIDIGNAYCIEITTHECKISKVKTVEPVIVDHIRPTAEIVDFIDGNQMQPIIKVVIGFDKIISNDFFNKFSAIINNDLFFSRVSKITIEDKGKRLFLIDLYTKISKAELQKNIDKLNQTPL